ncbi:MAG: NAD-dependent epimerase/dehydratase family protein [Oligoflexia bacterium]|nr:NAD-dependent epimerase/dehydratase family protein [Oligoflexia bacterium]
MLKLEELRGQKLFITGGTGFIGKWLLESFVSENDRQALGAEAWVLTRDAQAFKREMPELAAHPSVHFVTGDVTDFRFPDQSFSHVIHGAASANAAENEAQPLETSRTIIQGTERVLDLARKSGTKRLLLLSSGAIYGKDLPDLIHEDSLLGPNPLDPRSAYGESKRMAELLCAIAAKTTGMEVKIARIFALAGPRLPLNGSFAVGNFIRDALTGGPIRIAGDGSPLRSYLYAGDMTRWLWTLLFQAPSLRPYNVGSDETFSILEIARLVARETERALGKKIEIEVKQKADPSKTPSRYIPSIERARHELGLQATVKLTEAVQRMIDWERRQK